MSPAMCKAKEAKIEDCDCVVVSSRFAAIVRVRIRSRPREKACYVRVAVRDIPLEIRHGCKDMTQISEKWRGMA